MGFAGGITGVAGATVIKYCGNYGTIVGCGATTMSLAGGIMGCQGAENITCHIYNCFNLGDVSVVSTHEASVNPLVRSIINSDLKVDVEAGVVRYTLKPHKVFLFKKDTEERILPEEA